MAVANDLTLISKPVRFSSVRVWSGRFGTLTFILLASWLFPARTARRSLCLPLATCWLIHFVLGLSSALFLVAAVIAHEESPVAVLRAADEALVEWARHPIAVSLAMLGVFLWIELSHLVLAFVVFAWGGIACERLRDSYGHAIKQVWLRTPHALLLVLLIGIVALALDNAGDRWRAIHPEPHTSIWPTWPTPSTLPEGDPNYLAAQKKYEQEMKDVQIKAVEAERIWKEWRMTQPWLLRHEEPLAILAGCLAAAWWLAALLRAVGIKRNGAVEQRSPFCLWCGYDLSTMSLESRCPECGQSVANSLGGNAQPGAAWEGRLRAGRVSAWWHTWRLALKDPVAFGRTLRLGEFRIDHRVFFLLHLPAIFIVGAAGLGFGAGLTAQPGDLSADWAIVFFMVGLFGAACVLGTVLVVCGSASLMGWLMSLQARRNLLPASMQIAAYSTTYLVAWAFFGAVMFNSMFHLQKAGMFQVAQDLTGIHADALIFFFLLVPNLICGLIYLWLIARGTKGARYANR
jgi:hypothetical protein